MPRPTRYAVLLNDTSISNHHGCDVVMERIRAKCDEYALRITAAVPLRGDWQLPEYRSFIDTADIVLVNAEGSVHGSREIARQLISVADYCQSCGIPTVFFNGVYQDNDARMLQMMRQFDRVFVRESRSQAELGRSGITANMVPDMIFSHKLRQSLTDAGTIDYLITDSVDAEVTATALRLARMLPESRFVSMRMKPVDRPVSIRNFLGFHLQKRISRQAGPVRIYGWGQEAHCRTIDDLEALVRASRVVITGRFHMACLCLLLKTPLITLPSNSHKTAGMLEDIGLAHRIISPDQLTPDVVRQSGTWTDGESAGISRYLAEANNSIDQMFIEFRKLTDNPANRHRGNLPPI